MALATDTPDFQRARNATDILSQVWILLSYHHIHRSSLTDNCCFFCFAVLQTKYKHIAEMDRANYTTVIDTPDIIHAQQMKNMVSQVCDMPSWKVMNYIYSSYCN